MANKKNDELQTYLSVGIIFLVSGIGMMVPEGTRAVGIPFLVLGITFLAISSQDSKAKKE